MSSKWVILVAHAGVVRLVRDDAFSADPRDAKPFDSWPAASKWILAHKGDAFSYQIVELTHTINPAVIHDCCRNPVCQGHAAGCNYATGN
jgi:hypothetical protein